MVFVPMRHYAPDPFPLPGFGTGGGSGYRLFFVADDIAVTQLLVNVAFAALAGAILTNLSKRTLYRVLYVIGACIAVVAVGVGVFALKRSMENASKRAGQDESFADDLLKKPDYSKFDRVKMAEDHLHAAAKNWRLALRFDKAKRVEKRADEVAKMSAGERERINQGATAQESGEKKSEISEKISELIEQRAAESRGRNRNHGMGGGKLPEALVSQT